MIGKADHLPFLNTRNELYREMNMKTNPPPRAEAIRLMSANPNLIKRPLLVRDGRILFGFDETQWGAF
ncbi:hypothetical protein IRI77_32665 [Paludibaculum fermentans]|uniref:Arsenate reductase n=1 Tax=Paludibaculum fermentans TaxID=1473598 RepID=A0A7S7SKW1_PALFE|nr:hypothetical protein IRI77_32665 [Paludibaculum fermentans]